jgi:hypothetical protein
MKTPSLAETGAVHTAVGELFDAKPPALVEVRFPKMATSSDWFLCEDVAALDAILGRLGPGAEIRLNSVWDLKNPAGAIVVRTSKQGGWQLDGRGDGAAVGELFDAKPPALVEVRFPKMATSSDWFLCEDAAALDAVLGRLGPGTEVRLNSVWDLKNPAGAVLFQQSKPAGVADRTRLAPSVRARFEPPSPS